MSRPADSHPAPAQRQRLISIQILRAVAASMVLVYHLFDIFTTYGLSPARWFQIGASGVDIFFVISGFIVAHTAGDTDRAGFLAKRLVRIIPIYWLLTLSIFAIGEAAPHLLNTTRTDLLGMIQSLLFIPFTREAGGIFPLIPVGWTLNYEMLFYLVFAACMTTSTARSVLRVSVVLVALAIAGWVAAANGRYFDTAAIQFYTRGIVIEFIYGMVLCLIWRTAPGWLPRIWPLLPLGMVLLATVSTMKGIRLPREIVYGLPALCIVAGTLALRVPDNRLSRIGATLGDASYAMYLVHAYVIHLATKSLAMAGLTSPLAAITGGIVTYAVVAMVSIGLYRGIEAPLNRRLRRHLKQRPAAGQSRTS
ncbi:acyltransferase [Tistrella bauzanensis]|uniref:Acyltransferase n=1 Tax=Tistrella bauzanensis TaxID=657419 RepID=A0ABQ1IH72_9PROT|nr:acyltransferase [Tistrella bauzanensis]GGB41358.1 acyltransferase [Tistrella bauzanensis]